MATGGVRSLYDEGDRVSEWLLHQVTKWVLYHRLPSLARSLELTQAQFSRIRYDNITHEEEIFRGMETAVVMAKTGAKRLHKEHDKEDEYLLNQVSTWVLYDRLGLLARDLGITQAEFTRIGGAKTQPEEQIFQVLYKWFCNNTLSVKDLVKEMVAWQHNRYLDPGIWMHLQSKIDPAALPTSIPLPHLQPPQPQSAAIGARVTDQFHKL